MGAQFTPTCLPLKPFQKSVFKNVYIKASNPGLSSFVFYASDKELNVNNRYTLVTAPSDLGLLITDDYNPVESLTAHTMEMWRSQDVKVFGYVSL
jgi:hypothetical protein